MFTEVYACDWKGTRRVQTMTIRTGYSGTVLAQIKKGVS